MMHIVGANSAAGTLTYPIDLDTPGVLCRVATATCCPGRLTEHNVARLVGSVTLIRRARQVEGPTHGAGRTDNTYAARGKVGERADVGGVPW